MRYEKIEQLELLCAEYVLGTLQGPARRRFEGLLVERTDIRARLAVWDERLNTLAEGATPATPSPSVWQAIVGRIDPMPSEAHRGDSAAGNRLPFWRGIALASTLASAVLAFLLVSTAPDPVADPGYVVMLRDRTDRPVWVINTSPAVGEMLIKATAKLDMPEGKRCYLWLQPLGSSQRYRLGLLPDSGQATLQVPAELSGMMPGRLLVSVESEATPLGKAPEQLIEIRDEWLAPVTNQI